jgi:hypothetical protein
MKMKENTANVNMPWKSLLKRMTKSKRMGEAGNIACA